MWGFRLVIGQSLLELAVWAVRGALLLLILSAVEAVFLDFRTSQVNQEGPLFADSLRRRQDRAEFGCL